MSIRETGRTKQESIQLTLARQVSRSGVVGLITGIGVAIFGLFIGPTSTIVSLLLLILGVLLAASGADVLIRGGLGSDGLYRAQGRVSSLNPQVGRDEAEREETEEHRKKPGTLD